MYLVSWLYWRDSHVVLAPFHSTGLQLESATTAGTAEEEIWLVLCYSSFSYMK